VLRKAGFRVLAETGERGMKAQMRAANKAGVRFAVIIGENEVASGTASIKDMTTSEQGDVAFNEVATALVDKLNHGTGRPAIGHQE
jgi:histidyl-tRNA synthetase